VITATGWTVGAIAAFLTGGGLLVGQAPVIALGAIGLFSLAGAWAWTLRRYSFTVARTLDSPRVAVGGEVVSRAVLTNVGRSRAPGMMLLDRVGEQTIVSGIGAVPPNGSQTIRHVLPTMQRGVLPVGPIQIQRSDPLGLVRRTRGYGEESCLRVHPRVIPLELPPVGLDRSLDGDGLNELRGDMQFDSLREYVPGDDVRRIHWRSSARSATLLVREHVDVCQPATTVMLDNREAVWSSDDAFEHAVAAATSLAFASARSGHPTLLQTLSDACQPRRGDLGELLDFASEISRAVGTERPGPVLERVGRSTLSDLLVFITGDLDAPSAREVAAVTAGWLNRTCVTFGTADSQVPAGVPTIAAQQVGDFVRAWSRRVEVAA